MVNPVSGLQYYSVNERFAELLQRIETNNRKYRYDNVDYQLSVIKNNLKAANDNPELLEVYKSNLLPHLERLDNQLRRLVA